MDVTISEVALNIIKNQLKRAKRAEMLYFLDLMEMAISRGDVGFDDTELALGTLGNMRTLIQEADA
jgi:hypothetical protein